MLKIDVPPVEVYDELTNTFLTSKPQTIQLEHSLVSLSKWESKWHKPFLSKEKKTVDETLDYIRCMTLTQNVDPLTYFGLTSEQIRQINDYIEDPMTATTFSKEEPHRPNREVITSEIIYYWMISLGIPFECQKWHLSRLLTLINVCNIKNKPPKKMSRKELAAQTRSLNSARRARLGTRG